MTVLALKSIQSWGTALADIKGRKMFKSTTIYLVEPTAELSKSCEQNHELWECIREPIAWTAEEGGQAVSTEVERSSRVKILALGFFLGEFRKLDELLCSPSVEVEIFDKYWTLSRIEPEGTIRELAEETSEIIQTRFKPTGNSNVDDWIAGLAKN